MSITFRPAVREKLPLLLGLAGGTGSGKTFSALELAKGISQGARFAVIDSENGRASTYADQFDFDTADLRAPFRPQTYTDAILAADAAGYPVIVVDSASHEWYGDGGCLDWHDEIMGTDQKKNITAWIEPKKSHKRMVTRLLQTSAHVILCFRAEPKVEVETDSQGRMKVIPKASLTGLDGWIPIAEKNLPYELTASFLLMADKPGVPKPIKLPEPLQGLMPAPGNPLDAKVGLAMAKWALGGTKPTAADKREALDLEEQLLALAETLGKKPQVGEAIDRARSNPDGFHEWLKRQVDLAREAVSQKEDTDGSE
jgi:hypothetical protein